jgi:hypothetical protein
MSLPLLRAASFALAILMSLAQSVMAAERVTLTGKFEPAVCPAACGACCGAYLLQDSSKQINVYVGNSFVDLSGINGKSTLHRISGSFYETTGLCGLSQCALFLVEDVDQEEGGVAEYDAQTDKLEVPVATIIQSKERFAVTLKAPFTIDRLTPLSSIRKMTQGQSCAAATEQCTVGLSCESYFGIARAAGPQFSTCEIPCAQPGALCPLGQACVTVADGPGQVCQALPK